MSHDMSDVIRDELLSSLSLDATMKMFLLLVEDAGGWVELDELGYLHIRGNPDEDFTLPVERLNYWIGEGLIQIEIDENG